MYWGFQYFIGVYFSTSVADIQLQLRLVGLLFDLARLDQIRELRPCVVIKTIKVPSL